ncbi:MAG: glycoside hydrolase family 2 protein [Promethearchaeota archaeon]
MRFKFDLNGLWFFQIDPDNLGIEQEWFKMENYQYIFDKYIAVIPGCWEMIDEELKDYKGIGWYFKEFILPHEFERKKVSLVFEGVNNKADVYLDGKLIGSHEGGFLPFELEITGISTEEVHFLAIRVENVLYYSGIHRDVYLEFYDWMFLDEYIIDTEVEWATNNTPKSAKIMIQTRFLNTMEWEFEDCTVTYVLSREKAELIREERKFNVQKHNTRLLTQIIQIPQDSIFLWSIEDPQLYDLKIEVRSKDNVLFEIIESQVGIREFEVKDDELYLNKQKINMKGIITEFETPDFGLTLPKAVLIKNLKDLKAKGINTIRLKDYPTEKVALELMDRLGFIVIEELGPIDLKDPKTKKLIRDLIKRDRNHPCIFSWNLEVPEDPKRNINLEVQKDWYARFERV